MLDELFMRVLDMTKAGSVVILAVILGRLLLKKAPKVFSYALWLPVLLRLLCPVSIELPVSAMPEMAPVSESYELSGEDISFLDASTAAYHAVGDALNGGLGIQHVYTQEQDEAGFPVIVSTSWNNVWILFGQYVWVAGIAIMLICSAVSYGKLRRKLTSAVPLRENIYIAQGVASPFVIGLLRPRIYLPELLSRREQEYILFHERYHIRRLDHIAKALLFLALVLHWFNPLVWLAFVLACRDMEMSCDEAVVQKLGGEIRGDYAASLLSFATGGRRIAGTPLAFGESDTGKRIRNLARWRKPGAWVLGISAAVCAVLAVCFLTDPVSKRTPYSITAALRSQDVQWVQATVWGERAFHFMLSDTQTQQLVQALNGLQSGDFRQTKGVESAYSFMLDCGEKEILLQFDGEQVLFVFDEETAELADGVSWKTENGTLAELLETLCADAMPSGIAFSELENIKDKLSRDMVQYRIATLDADETTGLLDIQLYQRVDGLEEWIAQYIDLKYVRISLLEGELRFPVIVQSKHGQVTLTDTTGNAGEFGYRISTDLGAADLSGVWTHPRVEAHLERFRNMTQMEWALSSQIWNVAYIDADSWQQCQQETGLRVFNPLETADWLTRADSDGISFDNGVVSENRHHVRVTAYIPKNIVMHAGYLDGDVRIAFSATMQAESGTYTTGHTWSRYVAITEGSGTTGTGAPVLIVTPEQTASYTACHAYWQTGNVLYSVHLTGAPGQEPHLQDTLNRILAEF